MQIGKGTFSMKIAVKGRPDFIVRGFYPNSSESDRTNYYYQLIGPLIATRRSLLMSSSKSEPLFTRMRGR